MNAPEPQPTATPPPARQSVLDRLRRFMPYFSGSGWALPCVVLATTIAAVTEPAIPALMKPLLDNGFKGGTFSLWLVPAALMGLFALRGIAGFVAQYALAYMANQGMVNLRRRLFEKLQTAPVNLFSQTSASTLSNTVVYEVQTGTTLLVNAMLSLLKDSLTLVALLSYLLYINWKLTLIVLFIFPAVAWVMKVLSRRLHHVTIASQKATDHLAYVVEENVLAHRVVRLHSAQQSQAERFDGLNISLRRLAMKSTIAASAMTPLTQLLAAAALSAVICTALWQSSTSGITVGAFASFVTAMLMLIAPIKHLSESAAPITRGLAAVERGLNLIDNTPEESQGTHTTARAAGEILFDAVTVRYAGAERNAVDHLTLHVHPGQTVALVGSSGSGKTTLVNMLPRFVEPTSGHIALDGVALPDWQLTNLRQQFSFVSQDVVMFNDSLAANVALGLDLDPARVMAALEAANLADMVKTLPQGIHTTVGHNATQLSGGQRQRVAIARALYKDAPILILDEATSALDSESELAVKTALQRLMAGRTTLIIAHRLSTIEHADHIVVMHDGHIMETGNHSGLLLQNGHYARMVRLASAGNLDESQESILQ
jgi:subfamily B ATP-binding cassette protein MsbA